MTGFPGEPDENIIDWLLNTSKVVNPESNLILATSGNDLVIDFDYQAEHLAIAQPGDFVFFHNNKVCIAKPDIFLAEFVLIED